jgi:serine protease AprX
LTAALIVCSGPRPIGHLSAFPQTGLPVAPPALNAAKFDPLLLSRATLATGQSPIVATSVPDALDALALLIQRTGGTISRRLPIINGVAATVPNTSLSALSASGIVDHLAYDRMSAGAMERTGPTIGATAVRQELGCDGSNIGVAVIDSGVTSWHDDLGDPAVPGSQRVSEFVDLVNGASAAYDDYGHGTHVAGIIAGNGFDSNGARSGIAPGARLVVLKALDGSGQGRISNIIAALDYAVAHQADFNIRIVNLSVGAGVSESYNLDPLTVAARRAVEHGIVVVAAAGNAGRNRNGDAQYGSITAPGNAPWVLTVGASSTMGTIDRGDDTIAAFSSRGPTAFDRAAKPDLVAPGVGTESLSAPGSAMYNSLSPYLLNGTVPTSYLPYLSLSGTSMAAPVVAGTVALMLQVNPSLTPNEVKAILQYTAQNYPGYDALTQGAGFLNAKGAVELANYFGSPSTVAYPSTDGWSGQITWGNYRIQGGQITPDATAWQSSLEWGAEPTPTSPISWGVICTDNCDGDTRVWSSWAASCLNAACSMIGWGAGSKNVVWGTSCALGCPSSGTGYASGTAVVWGSSDNDAVVWGSSDGGGDAVVWGSSDGDAVVWGSSCTDPSCTPVIWQN